MIKNNEIKGCPLDVEDAKRALYLFGKSEAMVKVKKCLSQGKQNQRS